MKNTQEPDIICITKEYLEKYLEDINNVLTDGQKLLNNLLNTNDYITFENTFKKMEYLIKAGVDSRLAFFDTLKKYTKEQSQKRKEKQLLILKKFLELNIDLVNAKNDEGDTGLIIASKKLDLELVNLFLQYGANPDHRNNKGDTPILTFADVKPNEKVYNILLSIVNAGANIRYYKVKNSVNFHSAKVLLQHGINVEIDPNNFVTMRNHLGSDANDNMNVRCVAGHPREIEKLKIILKNAILNPSNLQEGYLHTLFGVYNYLRPKPKNQLNILKMITEVIKSGFPIDTPDQDNLTPIDYLIEQRLFDQKLTVLLINYGSNPNILKKYVEKNDLEAVQFLLRNGALIPDDIKSNNQKINEILLEHQKELVKERVFFAEKSAELKELIPNLLPSEVRLIQAFLTNKYPGDLTDDLSSFFDKLPIQEFHSKNGDTFLHFFAEYGNIFHIKYLIAKNELDLNVLNNDGNSPLYISILTGNTEVTKELLNSGTNPNYGRFSSLNLAITYDNLELVKLLLECGAVLNEADSSGISPIIQASSAIPEILELLLNKQANVNLINPNGDTPLDIAFKENRSPRYKLALMAYGAKCITQEELYSNFYEMLKNIISKQENGNLKLNNRLHQEVYNAYHNQISNIMNLLKNGIFFDDIFVDLLDHEDFKDMKLDKSFFDKFPYAFMGEKNSYGKYEIPIDLIRDKILPFFTLKEIYVYLQYNTILNKIKTHPTGKKKTETVSMTLISTTDNIREEKKDDLSPNQIENQNDPQQTEIVSMTLISTIDNDEKKDDLSPNQIENQNDPQQTETVSMTLISTIDNDERKDDLSPDQIENENDPKQNELPAQPYFPENVDEQLQIEDENGEHNGSKLSNTFTFQKSYYFAKFVISPFICIYNDYISDQNTDKPIVDYFFDNFNTKNIIGAVSFSIALKELSEDFSPANKVILSKIISDAASGYYDYFTHQYFGSIAKTVATSFVNFALQASQPELYEMYPVTIGVITAVGEDLIYSISCTFDFLVGELENHNPDFYDQLY